MIVPQPAPASRSTAELDWIDRYAVAPLATPASRVEVLKAIGELVARTYAELDLGVVFGLFGLVGAETGFGAIYNHNVGNVSAAFPAWRGQFYPRPSLWNAGAGSAAQQARALHAKFGFYGYKDKQPVFFRAYRTLVDGIANMLAHVPRRTLAAFVGRDFDGAIVELYRARYVVGDSPGSYAKNVRAFVRWARERDIEWSEYGSRWAATVYTAAAVAAGAAAAGAAAAGKGAR